MRESGEYSLGSGKREQRRLEEQQRLYGDSQFLTFRERDTVCEVGCGAGANLWIASKLKKGRFIGIDIQKEQIRACRKRAKELLLTNVEFHPARGQEIPLIDASTDATFCRLVLIHISDPLKVIQEMCRITKPQGRVISIEPAVKTYATTKTALFKCFKARIEYVYGGGGYGTLEIAQNLHSLFKSCKLEKITINKHEIFADGTQKERLVNLLKNWLLTVKPIQNELLEHNLITQEDLLQAKKEMTSIKHTDYLYQELWIAEGIKV